MTIRKVPIALIQVLDSESKVTNLEVEYIRTYIGDDPELAKVVPQAHVREEVTAEEFDKLAGESSASQVAELKRQALLIQDLRDGHATEVADLRAQLQAAQAAASEAATKISTIESRLVAFRESLVKELAALLAPV